MNLRVTQDNVVTEKNNLSKDNFKLSKEEILRGYNTYQSVIQNSVLVSTDFLKAFIHSEKVSSKDIKKSPPVTFKVKVGFVIAKKKIRKSFQRNRLKRLLKEAYRLNKLSSNEFISNISLIFGMTEKGYDYFKLNPRLKIEIISGEMIKLRRKIIKQLNSK